MNRTKTVELVRQQNIVREVTNPPSGMVQSERDELADGLKLSLTRDR